ESLVVCLLHRCDVCVREGSDTETRAVLLVMLRGFPRLDDPVRLVLLSDVVAVVPDEEHHDGDLMEGSPTSVRAIRKTAPQETDDLLTNLARSSMEAEEHSVR